MAVVDVVVVVGVVDVIVFIVVLLWYCCQHDVVLRLGRVGFAVISLLCTCCGY